MNLGKFLDKAGADPGFLLGGSALVSFSTSTPINHIVFFLQNTSCIRKPQIISGGGAHPLHPPPRSAPVKPLKNCPQLKDKRCQRHLPSKLESYTFRSCLQNYTPPTERKITGKSIQNFPESRKATHLKAGNNMNCKRTQNCPQTTRYQQSIK